MKKSPRGKRVSTSQTNKSITQKKPQSSNAESSFQLPKINRSHIDESISNYSRQYQKESYGQNFDTVNQDDTPSAKGIVDYGRMTEAEIQQQHIRLREEFQNLTRRLKDKQNAISCSKISKNPLRKLTHQQIAKQMISVDDELYHNQSILEKLRVECEQIQRRSAMSYSTMPKPNADINEKMIEVKQKIFQMKEKIKGLKKKTKEKGNDIVNSDQVHELLAKLERQEKVYIAKQNKLEGQIRETNFKLEQYEEKLTKIQGKYHEAEDYIKLYQLENEEREERNIVWNEYRQKEYMKEVLVKRVESFQQSSLQKYHGLLKTFQNLEENHKQIDKQLIDCDVKILKNQNYILDLETQQEQFEQILNMLRENEQLARKEDMLHDRIREQEYQQGSTFLTGDNYYSTGKSLKMTGVKSILEENESDVKDSIDHEGEKVELPKGGKLLFTKLQRSKSPPLSKMSNDKQSLTTKNIKRVPDIPKQQDKKYYVSSRQIAKNRELDKVNTHLKKQSYTQNNIKTAKKIKETSTIVAANNRHSSVTDVHQQNSDASIAYQKKTSGYIRVNNPANAKTSLKVIDAHQSSIQKGKQVLRERKASVKLEGEGKKGVGVVGEDTKLAQEVEEEIAVESKGRIQGENQISSKEEINEKGGDKGCHRLEENQQIEDNLREDNNNNSKIEKKLPQLIENNEPINRSQGTVKSSSSKRNSQSRDVYDKRKNSSQRKSRKDSANISQRSVPFSSSKRLNSAEETFNKIDLNNLDYTKKILELKEQLKAKEHLQTENDSGQNVNDSNIEENQGSNAVENDKEKKQQKMDQKQSATVVPSSQSQSKQNSNPNEQVGLVTMAQAHQQRKQQKAEGDANGLSDDDVSSSIGDDLGEINKMIKGKLQSYQTAQALKSGP